jgi:hypothetical protein
MAKYDSHHTYESIADDSMSIRSDCYSILFENKGDGAFNITIGGVPRTLQPGESCVYNANHPDIIIKTIWDSAVFAAFKFDGITPVTVKNLYITREFLSQIECGCEK